METYSKGSKWALKFSPDQVDTWSRSKGSDQIKMQNEILYSCWEDVNLHHGSEITGLEQEVLIGVVFYNSGTNSFISVPEIFAGYMVMELVAYDEVKRIHVGADKIAKAQSR